MTRQQPPRIIEFTDAHDAAAERVMAAHPDHWDWPQGAFTAAVNAELERTR